MAIGRNGGVAVLGRAGAMLTICAIVALSLAPLSPAAAATHASHAGGSARGLIPPRDGGSAHRVTPRHDEPPQIDTDHLLVRLRSRPSDLATRFAREGATLQGTLRGTSWTVLSTPHGTARRVRHKLATDSTVSSVEYSYIRHVSMVPNDLGWSGGQDQYLGPLRVDRAWDRTQGAGVTIAILDTGVDLDHPEFAGRIVQGIDVVNGDSVAQDDFGHGTMVAGVAAAATNNGIGIAGIAGQAKIMPVKVLNQDGFGNDVDFATGIVWATDHGAQVINLSFGGPLPDPALTDAVNYALAHNVVVVAAAGNDGEETVEYPAAIPGVLAVGATGDNGTLTYFSSYGWRIDVTAPGLDIVSTALAPGNSEIYDVESGTSFSSPIVAGVAALVRAEFPSLTAAQVADRIRSTARDVGPSGVDPYYGHGVVDALAAVGGPLPAPHPSFQSGPDEPNDTPARATNLGAVSGTLSHTGSIAPEGDSDWYGVDLTAGHWYNASVTPVVSSDGLDPRSLDAYVEIYNASGAFMARADNSGPDSTETLRFPVTQSGHYLLHVGNVNGTPSPGTYALSVATTSAPSGVFQASGDIDLGAVGGSVAIGDVTGDGRNDIVVATGAGQAGAANKLYVIQQLPDRSLRFATVLDADAGNGSGLAIGDLDGDGENDIALPTTAGIDIFTQSGGLPTAHSTIASDLTSISSLAIADLDGDGRNDLVAGGPTGTWILRNTGSGFVETRLTIAGTKFVRVGDVTGDGRPDIVTGSDPGGLDVLVQQTNGTWTDVHDASIAAADSAAIGELTGDGRLDIVTAPLATPASVSVVPQTAGGALGTPATYSVTNPVGSLAVSDVNGDGRIDVVTLHSNGQVGVLSQQPNGTLGTEKLYSFPAIAGEASHLAVGDYDSDGAPDLVTASSDGFALALQNGTSMPTLGNAWVHDTSPANVAVNVSPNVAPTVTLGRALDPATINPTNMRLVDGAGNVVPTSFGFDTGSGVLTLTPASPLAAGPYTVRIDGVRDGTGDELDGFGAEFTVGAKPDETPPQTTIAGAPSGNSTATSINITFSSNEAGSVFECSFDHSADAPCTSPYKRNVALGSHTFSVFARDAAGNEDATPATASWTTRAVPHGYWLIGAGGTVYSFGTVVNAGSVGAHAVDLEGTPSGFGYWIVDSSGHVFAFGDAKAYGNAPALLPGETVTSISRTANGAGYWLFTTRGRVFPFGNAPFLGDMRNVALNGPVLDSVATTTGRGYYMVASDGGVFSFGDARFYGSMGGRHLNAPVRSLVPDADGVGYWLVASDGGVFAFRAPFRGSMGSTHLNQPIVGMVRFGNGYLMVAADGGIFDFSNQPFFGSLGADPPPLPIVSVASEG